MQTDAKPDESHTARQGRRIVSDREGQWRENCSPLICCYLLFRCTVDSEGDAETRLKRANLWPTFSHLFEAISEAKVPDQNNHQAT